MVVKSMMLHNCASIAPPTEILSQLGAGQSLQVEVAFHCRQRLHGPGVRRWVCMQLTRVQIPF